MQSLCKANPAIDHGVWKRIRTNRTARAKMGSGRHRRCVVGANLSYRLAGPRSGHSRRGSLRRCHRSLCHGGRGLRRTQHRRETGRGAHIDASMYEICVQQMRDAILADPAGIRRSAKEIAIREFFTRACTQCEAMTGGLPSCCPQRRIGWSAGASRDIADAADAPARDAAIEAWSRKLDGEILMDDLQRAGIAAGIVQDVEDLLEFDPQLAARGCLMVLPSSSSRSVWAHANAHDASRTRIAALSSPKHRRAFAVDCSNDCAAWSRRALRNWNQWECFNDRRRCFAQPQGFAVHGGRSGLSAAVMPLN